jgi:hypothetical protein
MIQRKTAFGLAGLIVAIVPATSAAAPAAAGAGVSTSSTTVSSTPAAANVGTSAAPQVAAAPLPAAAEPQATPPVIATAEDVREGFYLRIALGGGFMFGTTKVDIGPALNRRALTFASDLSFGGAIARGVVVGAGVYGNVPGYGKEVTGGPSFIMLACPFADIYVDPANGFHMVGGPCYASARFENEGVSLQGWGANLGIGYEWSALWGSNLGRDWSLGVLARAEYANLAGTKKVDPFTAVIPSLLVTATWY